MMCPVLLSVRGKPIDGLTKVLSAHAFGRCIPADALSKLKLEQEWLDLFPLEIN